MTAPLSVLLKEITLLSPPPIYIDFTCSHLIHLIMALWTFRRGHPNSPLQYGRHTPHAPPPPSHSPILMYGRTTLFVGKFPYIGDVWRKTYYIISRSFVSLADTLAYLLILYESWCNVLILHIDLGLDLTSLTLKQKINVLSKYWR